MDYKIWMETAVLAGEIMLKSGAETYRVEDTINRILQYSGVSGVDAFVMPTGIVAMLDNYTDAVTVVRRISNRSINLKGIYEANEVSRRLCSGKIDIEEAYTMLKEITYDVQNPLFIHLALLVIPVSFALLLGGGLPELLGALAGGTLLTLIRLIERRIHTNAFLNDVISAAGGAVGVILFRRFFPGNFDIDLVIISTIMPLVPGSAITNAIRDTLQGDYVSGTARAMEAFVMAFAIAVGVGAALTFMGGA